MLGLSSLGLIHTAISLVAVGAGLVSLIRLHRITGTTGVGKLYIATTLLTCLTSLGIFHHGGFGAPHVLAIITLVVLAVAAGARKLWFGRLSPYVETISYSATFLFHLIPAVTETSTRLPAGAPWATGPDDPKVKAASGILFVLFLIGAFLQAMRIKAQAKVMAA